MSDKKHARAVEAAKQIRKNCYLMRLLRMARVATRLYAEELQSSGLTPQQQQLLTAIVLMGAPTPTELARTLDIEKSTVSRNLKFLIAAELLNEEKTSGDRTRCVSVSDEGLELLSELLVDWETAQQRMEEHFGKTGLRKLRGSFDELLARSSNA